MKRKVLARRNFTVPGKVSPLLLVGEVLACGHVLTWRGNRLTAAESRECNECAALVESQGLQPGTPPVDINTARLILSRLAGTINRQIRRGYRWTRD